MSGAAEFFAMGGYGFYIWLAYGVAAGVIVGLFLWSRHGLKLAETREAQIGRRERRRPKRETTA